MRKFIALAFAAWLAAAAPVLAQFNFGFSGFGPPVLPPAGTSGNILTSDGSKWTSAAPAAGGVTSVSGTSNRITVTGTTTPQIDISASYVGQSSITTLGTITSGVWNGTALTASYIPALSAISGAITLSQMPVQADLTVLGNVSGGSAVPSALSATQLTTIPNLATTSLKGLSPALTSGQIAIGASSGSIAAQTLSGDATLSAGGVLTLATVTAAKGGTGTTYGIDGGSTAVSGTTTLTSASGPLIICTGATYTVTLPVASTCVGKDLYIRMGNSSGTRTIATQGADTFEDGNTSYTFTASGTVGVFSLAHFKALASGAWALVSCARPGLNNSGGGVIYAGGASGHEYRESGTGNNGDILRHNGTTPSFVSLSTAGIAASGANADITGLSALANAYNSSSAISTTNYTIQASDPSVLFYTGTTTTSWTLPSASGSTNKVYTIVNLANSTSDLTVQRGGGDTIAELWNGSGQTNFPIRFNEAVTLVAKNSSTWQQIGSNRLAFQPIASVSADTSYASRGAGMPSTVFVDASGASRTITLPTAATCGGKSVTVVKIDSSSNTVAVATTSSQTINGAAAPYTLAAVQWTQATFVSNGSNWVMANPELLAGSGITLTRSSGGVTAAVTGKASSGANSDITSLSGLTTPLTQPQGGSGDYWGLGAQNTPYRLMRWQSTGSGSATLTGVGVANLTQNVTAANGGTTYTESGGAKRQGVELVSNTTTNSQAYVATSAGNETSRQYGPVLSGWFTVYKTGDTSTTARNCWGFANNPANAMSATYSHVCFIRWTEGTDTNYQLVTNDGATTNVYDLGVAPTSKQPDDVTIDMSAVSSVDVWINGVKRASATTSNLPGSTTGLSFFAGANNLGNTNAAKFGFGTAAIRTK